MESANPIPESKPEPPRPTRRWRGMALAIVGAIALYGLAGSLLVPLLVKKIATERIGDALGRVVVIDAVSVNPYTLAATLKGLRILEPDARATFVSFESLDIDGSVASLYHLAPVVDELTLTGLKVNLVRDGDSHFNLTDIVDRMAAAARAAPRPDKKDEARFSIGNVRVVNAAIDFDDRPKGEKHQVRDMSLSIPFISNLPVHLKEFVKPSFSANVNGSPLQLAGETLPFEDSLATHLSLDLKALDLHRYVEYLPTAFPVKLDAGRLDAHIAVRFTQGTGKHASVDLSGTAAVRELATSTAAGKLAQAGAVEVEVASFDPLGGKARVKAIRLSDAVAMDAQWRVPAAEVRGIVLDLKARTASIEAVTSRDAVIALKRRRDGSIEVPQFPVEGAAPRDPPATPWNVSVAKVDVTGYKITVLDGAAQPATTHRLSLASLEARDVTTGDGLKGSASASIGLDKGGTLDVVSTFALEPLEVNAKLEARHIDIAPARAYLAQFPTVAITSGALSARGTLTLRGKADALRVAYDGTAEVAKLATSDRESKEDLLNWDSVKMGGIRFDLPADGPLALAIQDITVNKAFSRIVVLPDGKLNLQKLRAGPAQEPAPEPAAPPARNVRIERIAFVDSRLDFTDLFIRPNYSAEVGALHGSVTNLSSQPDSRAVVDLEGRYDRDAPVVITGTVNPLRGDLFLDIGAKGSGIELPTFTAYSQRYAGYGITAGKLTLDVKYHVEEGKLEGRNRIVVEQLTFGDKVESTEATKLPVLFAVNLLKDSNGRINLELPVSGSLADPQFAVGALVAQVLGNLLKAAVTSPFSLLAGAFGGGGGGDGKDGGDLAFVEFDPGRSEVSEAGQKKLEALVKALLDRPALKLEILARIDPGKDVAALKSAALRRKLAAAGGKGPAEESGEVSIDPADYPRLVKAEFVREKLAMPAEKGALPEPTVPEMEFLLLERIAIGEEELRALSLRRAEAARGLLVKGGLAPERVTIGVPAAPPADSKGRASRVDFALR